MINRFRHSGKIFTNAGAWMRRRWVAALFFVQLFCGVSNWLYAQVPPTVSQMVGVNHAIVDEKGRALLGTDKFSHQEGVPVVVGDLVQIHTTSDGLIYPPDENGEPDPRNPVLVSTRIGAGVSPKLPHSGKFSIALAPRPAGGTRIFVRVFNAASKAESSYYGDSHVFTVSSLSNGYFMVDVASTDKPLDGEDSDGDGLSNAMEKGMGSDPYSADTDGDGYSDADESVAGTDALGEESFPLFTSIRTAGTGLTRLSWWPSVSGRTYRIYHSDGLGGDGSGMNLAASLVSEGSANSVILTNASLSDSGVFIFRISK